MYFCRFSVLKVARQVLKAISTSRVQSDYQFKKKIPKLAASFGIFVMSQPLAIYFWISSVLEVARHLDLKAISTI